MNGELKLSTLIIGAGLIGVHIAKEIKERGNEDYLILAHKVDFNYIKKISNTSESQVIEHDASNSENLSRIIKDHGIQNIIIAAGSLHPAFKKHPGAAILNESRLMLSIFAACNKSKINKVVYISTLGVYGTSSERDEETFPLPVSPYGFTKLYNEQVFELLAKETETTVVVIRSTGTIGPNPEGSGNWMSTGLNNILKLKKNTIPTLSREAEYLDVRDLSSFVIDRIHDKNSPKFDVINLGPGYTAYANEIIAELRELTGQSIKYTEEKFQDHNSVVTLPIKKAKEKYRYSPKYNIKQTLSYISDFYD